MATLTQSRALPHLFKEEVLETKWLLPPEISPENRVALIKKT